MGGGRSRLAASAEAMAITRADLEKQAAVEADTRRRSRRRDAEMAFITLLYVPPDDLPTWPVVPSDRDEPEPWVPELRVPERG